MQKYFQIIDNIFTENECQQIIDKYEKSLLENKVNRFVDNSEANYYRIEINDDNIYKRLIEKVKLPLEYNGYKIYGFLKNMRLAKYETGGKFPIHQDAIFQDNFGRRSILTLNMFLNNNFTGGETTFLYDDKQFIYQIAKPLAGRAALFDREIYHKGNEVTNGYKYLLRTYVVTEY